MANSDVKNGLRPYKHVAGGNMGRMGGYTILNSLATAIYSGDLVALTGVGRNINLTADNVATHSVGVFAGCEYVNNDGQMVYAPYWPGVALTDTTKTVKALVYDDPMVEFVAQIDTIAEADIGLGYAWQNGTGNATTGRSGGYIDHGNALVQLMVVGLAEGPDGITMSEYGAFAKVRCRIGLHPRSGLLAVT